MSTLGSAGGLGEKPATQWRGGSDLDGKRTYELMAGRVTVLSRKWQAAINWEDGQNGGGGRGETNLAAARGAAVLSTQQGAHLGRWGRARS